MKILFIGLGGIGQRHLRNIVQLYGDDVEISAYRTRNLSHVVTSDLRIDEDSTLDEKYSFTHFDDLGEALAEEPDVAFICNPTAMHVGVALQAAKAGCDLFIEKPLGDTLQGVNELKTICESRRCITFVGYQLRFHPALVLLKEKLEQGCVGDVISVRVEVGEGLPNWHPYEDYRTMYAARQDLGGGVILSQIHEIDYLYWLFGKPTSLLASGGKMSDLDIDVEDTVDILLKYHSSRQDFSVSLHMDYVQNPPSRYCKIVGTKGALKLDFVRNDLTISDWNSDSKTYEFPNFERNQMFLDELEHFFECVKSRKQAVANMEVGIAGLEIALKIKNSLATGEIVNL